MTESEQPDSADAHWRLGVELRGRTRLIAARNAFRKAFELDHGHPHAYESLIQILSVMGEFDEALDHIRRAIEWKPQRALFHNDAGGALVSLGRIEEAARAFERAAELHPGWSVPLHNLSKIAFAQGDRDRGIRLLRRSAEIGNPPHMSHVELGVELLKAGEFSEGWQHYEWRWERSDGKPSPLPGLSIPLWDGTPLGDRTLLLWTEQGYGDILQFIRFVSLVPKEQGRVIVLAPKNIASLLATHAAIDQVVVDGDTVDVDLQFPLMSIPRLLQAVPEPIPPYLSAPPQCAEAEAAIERGTAFNVGIVWASGRIYQSHGLRDCPLELFAPLGAIPGVRLFSLQYGDQAAELSICPAAIVDLSPLLGDFHRTAAFVKRLDLVISVDTSMPHLAGALGVPVWLLAARHADWRWMEDRDDSPWYATMRIYRQDQAGDWAGPMARVARDLRARAGN